MVVSLSTSPIKLAFLPEASSRDKILSALVLCLLLKALWFFFPDPSLAADDLAAPTTVDTGGVTTQEISAKAGAGDNDFLDLLKRFSLVTQDRSPDFQIIKALQEQKKYQKYTAKANRYAPSLGAEISRERMINGYGDDGTTSAANSSSDEPPYEDGESLTDWNLDLDLPLYRRSTSLQDAIAGLEFELATANFAIAVKEIEIRLRELLGNYILASYNLLNLENSVTISSRHAAQIQRGYDLRDQTKLALLRSQANLEVLRAKKEANEQRKDQALRDLLDFTALNQGDPLLAHLDALLADEQQIVDLVGSFSTVEKIAGDINPVFAQATDDELRQVFEEKSPLARRIRLEQEVAGASALKYTQGEFPELAVRGEFMRKEDTPVQEMEGEGSIGIVLKVPVFSGGTIYSNTMTQRQAQRIAVIQGQSDLRKQFNALANKRKTIQSLKKIFELQKTHLQEQQEIVRLSLKSYQIKQTSMQELLDSNNDLIDAKSSLMPTNINLTILLLQFAWEIGGPLPF